MFAKLHYVSVIYSQFNLLQTKPDELSKSVNKLLYSMLSSEKSFDVEIVIVLLSTELLFVSGIAVQSCRSSQRSGTLAGAELLGLSILHASL